MNKLMTRASQSLGRLALGLAVAIGATSVQAAVSFPNYPLQTGSGLVPPNMMFILDNSGSMASDFMSTTSAGTIGPVDLGVLTTVKNSIAYDPNVKYKAWDTVDSAGAASVMTGGTTYTSVYSSTTQASGTTESLAGSKRSHYYLLRTANLDPNLSTSYDRYRISSTGSFLKSSVSSTNTDLVQNGLAGNAGTGQSFTVTLPATAGAVNVNVLPDNASGSGDVDLYVSLDAIPTTSSYQCASEGPSITESCTLQAVGGEKVNVYLSGYSNYSNVRLTINSNRMGTESTLTTTAAQLTNIATWYSYHRTRMKVAKGGAAAAFVGIGAGYRLGFDTINDSAGNANTTIVSKIPVNTNAGSFEGANKKSWFDSLMSQNARGATPLRSGLKRTGEYFRTAEPWTDGTGTAEQSCRASYTVLTTDGYWNGDANFTIDNGDVDGDGYANTLADVAAYYWKTDLRPTVDNNVPTNATDPADWQHMAMFSVSIGQQGSLPITTPPPSVWPDPTDQEDNERIDDLWHAAVNGRGPNLIVASQSDSFKNALVAALNTVKEQRASGSNITANGNSLNNGAQIFQALYSMPSWTGDVLAYAITASGISSTPQWSLADVANADPTNFNLRPVYTWYGSQGAVFNAANNPGVVGRTSGSAVVTVADNIAYLKGERSLEIKNGGQLRSRVSPIGDIVNSSPFYERQLTAVFIGANDGMLHGIDSDSGKVLFSYMPAGIDWAKLSDLSDPAYSQGSGKHIFSVDGQMDVSDTTQGDGSNILASGLGRGGRGIFALDVTGINTQDTNGNFNGTFGASNIKFDNTASAPSDMGYVLAQPQVRLLKTNGNGSSTAIITGNGIDSSTGEAVLYIYNTNGTVRKRIATGAAGGNGLSQTSVADLDNDGIVDTIYAGDLLGNVWKFDVSAGNSSQWSVMKLFTARDATNGVQPITGGITPAREPDTGNVFLVFGTGKMIGTGDLVSSAVQTTQSVYGLIDSSALIPGRASLQLRTFPYSGTDSKGRPARGLENYSALPTGKLGWVVDLATNADTYARGERVVTSPTTNGRAAWISSVIPLLGAGCNNAGRGYLNAFDIFTGTNPATGTGSNPSTGSFFDVDGNGKGDDKVGQGYVSSVDLGVAMPGAPAIVDTKVVVNGSNAQVASIDVTSGTASTYRIMWRELINLQ